ncbi:MAG TPA: S41 family peptidase, partial [Solirubrobacterales bacterium]|nr:S41 family peptidase [Solirubrobacterales bacterium]
LPEGEVVVSTDSRSQGESVHETGDGRISSLPLVVLVGSGTASAAEILAAALADNGDATIVGSRSFGKGVFQEEQPLANGGALKLTVGEYFTPEGVNLAESRGIHPDVKVKGAAATPADEVEERGLELLAARVGS